MIRRSLARNQLECINLTSAVYRVILVPRAPNGGRVFCFGVFFGMANWTPYTNQGQTFDFSHLDDRATFVVALFEIH
jgi:hypothetical protein